MTDIFFSTFWNFCTVTILWIFNVKKYVKKLPDDWANFFILVLEIGRKATLYEWPKQSTYLCTEARQSPEQDSAIAPFFFHLHWGRLTLKKNCNICSLKSALLDLTKTTNQEPNHRPTNHQPNHQSTLSTGCEQAPSKLRANLLHLSNLQQQACQDRGAGSQDLLPVMCVSLRIFLLDIFLNHCSLFRLSPQLQCSSWRCNPWPPALSRQPRLSQRQAPTKQSINKTK